MARILSIRKAALLPFPETQLQDQQRLTISSMRATGPVLAYAIVLSDQCRPYVRIKVQDRTSGQFMAAELVERLEMNMTLPRLGNLEIEVECIKACLFVGALKCAQTFDPPEPST